jgi:hypothetical protein
MGILLVGGTGCGGCVESSSKSGEGTSSSQASPQPEATQGPVNRRLNIRASSPILKLIDGGAHVGAAATDAGTPSELPKPE